jgi:hypothetical protein
MKIRIDYTKLQPSLHLKNIDIIDWYISDEDN